MFKGIFNFTTPVLAILIATLTAVPVGLADEKIEKTKLGGGVPSANARVGHPDNVLPEGFSLQLLAEGSDPLENPSGVITQFGFLNDSPPQPIEATKTEADENTYLVLDHNPGGPTPGYDYGRHFLFQGHENGGDRAYITRINLDVTDPAHRITLLTPVGGDGKTHFNRIDGSTWNPHPQTLLFTQENGAQGGVIEIGVDWGSSPRTLYGILGRGGYEGIHPDDRGNLIIIEDVGGTSVNVDPANPTSPKAARNPNSFVYRFVPYKVSDLSAGGELQALQVWIDGQPVQFVPVDTVHPFGDVFSSNQLKLHTLGTSWPVRWVTVHDTATDGTAEFDANAKAKAAGATPFKRPENLQFLPGSGFNTFFFDPTGDTNASAGNQPALAARGAWGSIFRVDFDGDEDDDRFDFDDDSKTGKISIFVLGDQFHSSFDNLAFVDTHILLAAEDRGDTLHKQLNLLDSVWAYDVRKPNAEPVRFLALGWDIASEIDAAFLDANTVGFQNDGDNEPTGVHVSDGDPSVNGLLGKPTNPDERRIFFTQQHGENRVWEVLGGGD